MLLWVRYRYWRALFALVASDYGPVVTCGGDVHTGCVFTLCVKPLRTCIFAIDENKSRFPRFKHHHLRTLIFVIQREPKSSQDLSTGGPANIKVAAAALSG